MPLSDAEEYLRKIDPVMDELINIQGHIEFRPESSYFEALVRSIISQQISVNSANKIRERFAQVTRMRPEKVLQLTANNIRQIGLSSQKWIYISDLAKHFTDDLMVFDHLGSLSDEKVIHELTKIKGIGVWTAQMFLIFTLHRPDIFAPDDRGLQIAVQNLYDFPNVKNRKALANFAEKWAPHRTTACLHLWQSLKSE